MTRNLLGCGFLCLASRHAPGRLYFYSPAVNARNVYAWYSVSLEIHSNPLLPSLPFLYHKLPTLQRIPDSVSVGKDAKRAFVKAAGIFILYLTYASTDFCKQHHRSTISAKDVMDALQELEFEGYTDHLEECLKHFRKAQQSKKDAKKERDARREEEKRVQMKVDAVDDVSATRGDAETAE